MGQSANIAIIAILNIVFVTTGYKTLYPEYEMQWYTNHYQELMAYRMWRTGVLAFSQMPVLFLFATRNNILLWLFDLSVAASMGRLVHPHPDAATFDTHLGLIRQHWFIQRDARQGLMDLGLRCHRSSRDYSAHKLLYHPPAGLRAIPGRARRDVRDSCGQLLVLRLDRLREHLRLRDLVVCDNCRLVLRPVGPHGEDG